MNKEEERMAEKEKNTYESEVLPKARSKSKEFIKKFMRRKTAVIALIFILFMVIVAIFGPMMAPYDCSAPDYSAMLQGPSAAHWWGTDEYGRDLFSRMLVGTRLSLSVALVSVIIGTVIGTVLGLVAGYYGGIIESIVMRGSDILFAFPDILLAIAVVAILGPGIINVIIAVAVFTVPSVARLARSATLTVKESLYIEVARSLGCKDWRILWVHIFPGTVQSLIVNFTMRIGTAILAAASLSFLGYGANVTEPEWGAILSQSRNYMASAPHLVLFPGLVMFLTVLAFNLLGDGLRDTLDPKMK